MGAGHPVDMRVAVITHAPVRGLHPRGRYFARVQHVNAHRRLVTARRHQSALDGRGADPGQDVATRLRIRDQRLIHKDLKEQIVQIRIRALRVADFSLVRKSSRPMVETWVLLVADQAPMEWGLALA